tara:strand:- start:402 stop:620 length:219 start_codon:yes stop_codon:yes gene_type:complete
LSNDLVTISCPSGNPTHNPAVNAPELDRPIKDTYLHNGCVNAVVSIQGLGFDHMTLVIQRFQREYQEPTGLS